MLLVDVEQAVELLKEGKAIAYPTEAVYGIGCDPKHVQVCQTLRQFKQRSDKGFILIASDFAQVVPWVDWSKLSKGQVDRIKHSWPGHTTWVMPASRQAMPLVLGPRNTLAVRVTSHPVAKALCEKFKGPIVSTSANRPGVPPAREKTDLDCLFEAKIVAAVVEGALGGAKRPSQIIDAVNNFVIRG